MDSITNLLRSNRRVHRQLDTIAAREVVPVVARYTTNAGQSIPNNTVTILNFEDVTFDPRGTVAVGAAWAFTCPVAGYYQIACHVTLSASTGWADGELLALDLYVGGSQVARLYASETHGSASSVEVCATGCTAWHLDKADELNIRALQISGAARTLTSDGTENYVSIARITP